MIKYSFLFAIIIVLSNYLFQYHISDWITWGAILFPFSFLMTDIISEKKGKIFALKVLRNGILLAILPTFFLVDVRIAIASISAYIIAQVVDVLLFAKLKEKNGHAWWLRNNVSTFVSQFLDTIIFFSIAFIGVLDSSLIISLAIGTIIIKWVSAILDTPLFYFFAIKK